MGLKDGFPEKFNLLPDPVEKILDLVQAIGSFVIDNVKGYIEYQREFDKGN